MKSFVSLKSGAVDLCKTFGYVYIDVAANSKMQKVIQFWKAEVTRMLCSFTMCEFVRVRVCTEHAFL